MLMAFSSRAWVRTFFTIGFISSSSNLDLIRCLTCTVERSEIILIKLNCCSACELLWIINRTRKWEIINAMTSRPSDSPSRDQDHFSCGAFAISLMELTLALLTIFNLRLWMEIKVSQWEFFLHFIARARYIYTPSARRPFLLHLIFKEFRFN